MTTDSFPANPKLPLVRRYEITPQPCEDPISRVVNDITAAHTLGLPFSVATVRTKAFRFGGNVNKADITTYVVTVGKSETTR